MSRAGRKRKNAPRTPTGQISRARAVVEREATSVACEARARLHGLPIASARHAEAGSALGRMLLRDQITRDAYDDGMRYARLHAALQSSLDTPGRVIEPRDGESRACPECGQTVRCEGCASDWSDRVRWQWDALGKLLTVWEAALLRQVVIADLDCAPMQAQVVVRALSVVGAYFSQARAA